MQKSYPSAQSCFAGRRSSVFPLSISPRRQIRRAPPFGFAWTSRQLQDFQGSFIFQNRMSPEYKCPLYENSRKSYEIAQSFFAETSGFRKSHEMRTFFPSSGAKALTTIHFAAIIPTKRAQRGTLRGFAAFFLYSTLYCAIVRNQAQPHKLSVERRLFL